MCNESSIMIGVFLYLVLIPFICSQIYTDTIRSSSFTKWYFTKSERVNYLGFAIFLILCSGSFIYVVLYYLAGLLYYILFIPIIWLFEFLFLNKDCSHLTKKKG